MRNADWKRAEDYEALKSLDTPDLAGEFLQRNPDYQSDRERLARLAAAGRLSLVDTETFASKWGVRFRPERRSLLVDAAQLAERACRRLCPFHHHRKRP